MGELNSFSHNVRKLNDVCRNGLTRNDLRQTAVPRGQRDTLPLDQIGSHVVPRKDARVRVSSFVPEYRGDKLERYTEFNKLRGNSPAKIVRNKVVKWDALATRHDCGTNIIRSQCRAGLVDE